MGIRRGREVIGVTERVMLPMLLTPELPAVCRAACLEASRTWWLDFRDAGVRWAHD